LRGSRHVCSSSGTRFLNRTFNLFNMSFFNRVSLGGAEPTQRGTPSQATATSPSRGPRALLASGLPPPPPPLLRGGAGASSSIAPRSSSQIRADERKRQKQGLEQQWSIINNRTLTLQININEVGQRINAAPGKRAALKSRVEHLLNERIDLKELRNGYLAPGLTVPTELISRITEKTKEIARIRAHIARISIPRYQAKLADLQGELNKNHADILRLGQKISAYNAS
jgi:hypothetical protein